MMKLEEEAVNDGGVSSRCSFPISSFLFWKLYSCTFIAVPLPLPHYIFLLTPLCVFIQKKSVRVTAASQLPPSLSVMKGDTPPSPLSPSSSVTDESSSRRTLYSVGSKDAKREEKARKEEEKARKEEQKAAARREEKARKEEQKAVQATAKKEEKAKKEKKTSNRAFFAKLKRKVQGSKRSDVDLEEKESLADASQSTGLSSEGVASDVMIPGENGNVKEESSWELISREGTLGRTYFFFEGAYRKHTITYNAVYPMNSYSSMVAVSLYAGLQLLNGLKIRYGYMHISRSLLFSCCTVGNS